MRKKEQYLIEKSNTLNGMQTTNMGLTELRFFLMYISKLNARNINNRTVSIDIKDFEELFGVSFNTSRFTEKILQIMSRTVTVYSDDEKIILTLYSEFRWKKGDTKTLQITCNDKMLPYLFELKSNYTSYMIGNIAKLNSVAKIRLYEIIKQYEKLETLKIELERLQKMMDCENSVFKYFKKDVLEPAIKDINEYTDIQVSYEKVLSCRKVVALTFTIKSKNQVQIEIQEPVEIVETVENTVENRILQPEPQQYPDLVTKVYKSCQKSYTMEQVQNLLDMAEMISDNPGAYIVNIYHTIRAYNTKINNMYNYTLSVIQANLSKKSEEKPSKKKKRETSYDIKEFMEFTRLNTINAIVQKSQEEEQEVNPLQQVETEVEVDEDFDKEFDEILASGELPF